METMSCVPNVLGPRPSPDRFALQDRARCCTEVVWSRVESGGVCDILRAASRPASIDMRGSHFRKSATLSSLVLHPDPPESQPGGTDIHLS